MPRSPTVFQELCIVVSRFARLNCKAVRRRRARGHGAPFSHKLAPSDRSVPFALCVRRFRDRTAAHNKALAAGTDPSDGLSQSRTSCAQEGSGAAKK